jgi:cell division protein ZapA
MPLVNVMINGRAYTLACDDGEEEHLRELGAFLDGKVRELSNSVGQVGDARLLLMAGLVVADELSDALGHIEERDKEIATLKTAEEAFRETAQLAEERAAQAVESAAERLEAIAVRLPAP